MKSNYFQVNYKDQTAISVNEEGLTIIKNLTLLDETTGNKWLLVIRNGELKIEPLSIEDKRNNKIKELINEK